MCTFHKNTFSGLDYYNWIVKEITCVGVYVDENCLNNMKP